MSQPTANHPETVSKCLVFEVILACFKQRRGIRSLETDTIVPTDPRAYPFSPKRVRC